MTEAAATTAPPVRRLARAPPPRPVAADRGRRQPGGVGRRRLPPDLHRGDPNVVAVIPGTDLADEYVVVGAHYDGLELVPGGRAAPTPSATGPPTTPPGVAAALWVADSVAAAHRCDARWSSPSGTGRRTASSAASHYIANPLVPLPPTPSPTSTSTSWAPTCSPSPAGHDAFRHRCRDRWRRPHQRRAIGDRRRDRSTR